MKCECIFICHYDCNRKDCKRQKTPEKAPFVRLSKNYRFPSSLSLETTLSSEY